MVKSNNADILNAIRNASSSDFQRRIPNATKANVSDSLKRAFDYAPTRNEFLDGLVNLIGLQIIRNMSWTNPLSIFKAGMLEFGDTIEEIAAGLLPANVYQHDRDYLEKDIFGQETPEIKVVFHKVNRENYYKLTIKEAPLKRAFLSEYGLQNLIVELMQSLSTSDNWDEYLLMTRLIREHYDNGGFFKVQVPDLNAQGSTEANAKFALRRMREMGDVLQFISRHYNPAHMPVAVRPEDLVLITTPQAKAAIDVEALAAAFNMERAQFDAQTIVVPQEHFNIPGAQAILTTKQFWVVADQRLETTSAANPVGLFNNYFLHHWQVISLSPFAPAILFTTEAGDEIVDQDGVITGIEPITTADAFTGEPVTTLKRGGVFLVGGEAVTTPEGAYNDAVRMGLTGAESPRTYITQSGTLHVGPDEVSTALTITATAVDDDTMSASLTRPVVGDRAVFWPEPTVIADSDNDGVPDSEETP